MLYHLLFRFADTIPALNVFRYITFRSAGAVVTALILSLALGPWVIRTLRRMSVGQSIRDVGPQSHQSKEGTPTMGGVLIVFSVIVPTLLWARLDNAYVLLAMGTMMGFAAIGFTDDFLKVRRSHNQGLSARAKFLGQCLVASAFAACLLAMSFDTTLSFPFFKNLVLELGVFYAALVVFFLTGASNAVNLTDGLDGLAIGATLIAAATYAVFCYIAGNRVVSDYLQVTHVPEVGEITVFCAALVGASLGFLWFNSHPAEVFMGDVGSLAIGGAIGAVAVLSKQEVLLGLVGGLFVIEALSVILQVGSFKLRGRRIFKMAPLHHHFELSGWKEPQIIVRFWILAILFSLISLSTLKLR